MTSEQLLKFRLYLFFQLDALLQVWDIGLQLGNFYFVRHYICLIWSLNLLTYARFGFKLSKTTAEPLRYSTEFLLSFSFTLLSCYSTTAFGFAVQAFLQGLILPFWVWVFLFFPKIVPMTDDRAVGFVHLCKLDHLWQIWFKFGQIWFAIEGIWSFRTFSQSLVELACTDTPLLLYLII